MLNLMVTHRLSLDELFKKYLDLEMRELRNGAIQDPRIYKSYSLGKLYNIKVLSYIASI